VRAVAIGEAQAGEACAVIGAGPIGVMTELVRTPGIAVLLGVLEEPVEISQLVQRDPFATIFWHGVPSAGA
jgi:hypothetical protein